MKRGDIVLVDWPYTDRTGSKVRPALIVQSDTLNQRIDDTIIALITSRRHRAAGLVSQVLVEISAEPKSGRRMDSVVQCENLLTVDTDIVIRTLGELSVPVMQQVDRGLVSALGL